MIELECDMWKEQADAHVITTNGDVNRNGEAVMGRGCAREAAMMFKVLPMQFGSILSKKDSNHVQLLGDRAVRGGSGYHCIRLVSFPVKHHWHERADIKLIERSAIELKELVDSEVRWSRVLVPRPGCGNGSLKWEAVKPVLEPILDDRFVIVFKRGSR